MSQKSAIEKQPIIAKAAIHEGDTGSPEVQVALLTARINHLTEHLKTNKNDNNIADHCAAIGKAAELAGFHHKRKLGPRGRRTVLWHSGHRCQSIISHCLLQCNVRYLWSVL